ncbi:MAG: hypothetical protein AAGG50_15425 [Bacteroidota bacterium]
MSQSLFVVIALSLAGLLSLQQLRSAHDSETRIIRAEMELMASGAALKIVEYAASRAFDERTTPLEIQQNGLPGGAGQFSEPAQFGETMPAGPMLPAPPMSGDDRDDDDRDDDDRDDDDRDDDDNQNVPPPSSPLPPAGNPCDLDRLAATSGMCDDLDDLHMDANEWQAINVPLPDGSAQEFEANVQVSYVRRFNGNSTLSGSQRSEQKRVVVRVRAPMLGGQPNVQLVEMGRVLVYRESRAQRRAGGAQPPQPPPPPPPMFPSF